MLTSFWCFCFVRGNGLEIKTCLSAYDPVQPNNNGSLIHGSSKGGVELYNVLRAIQFFDFLKIDFKCKQHECRSRPRRCKKLSWDAP